MQDPAPLVLTRSEAVAASVIAELASAGWYVQDGFAAADEGGGRRPAARVFRGTVGGAEEIAAVALAAAQGAGVVAVVADPDLLARLYDDLRRLGEVCLANDEHASSAPLDTEQARLLDLLAAGASLDQASRALHWSRRTVTRRLATARGALGVRTTAEAVDPMARRRTPVSGDGARTVAAALVGRDEELRELGELIRQGRAAVLVGEAGAGKTTLLRAGAAGSGRPAAYGGGLPSLRWSPYLAVSRALGASPPPGDSTRAAAWAMGRLGGRTLLIVDDLQWVDRDSGELFAALCRTGRSVLGAVRRGEPAAQEALDGAVAAGCALVDVGPLDSGAAAQIVRARRPELHEHEVGRLVGEGGGKPLLLEELCAPGGSAHLSLGLRAQLARQPTEVRRAAWRLAVLSRPAEPSLVGEGAGGLLGAGLAIEREGELMLRHRLVGEAIVAGLSARERTRVHAELAETVEDRGEAARHHAAAGARERAYALAFEAGTLATRPDERARHLALAAELVERPWWADELRLRAAEHLVLAGHHGDALRQAARVEGPDAPTLARASLWRARGLAGLDDRTGARRAAECGVALVRGSGGETEALLAVEAVRHTERPDARRARDVWTLARRAGTAEAEAQAALGRALAWSAPEEAEAHLRASIATARTRGDFLLELDAALDLVTTLHARGRVVEAQALCCELEMRCAAMGLVARELEVGLARLRIGVVARGHAGDCVAALRGGTVAPGPAELAARYRAVLAVALADLGDIAGARGALGQADASGEAAHARLQVEWLAGASEAALHAVPAGTTCADLPPAAQAVLAWARAEAGPPILPPHDVRPQAVLEVAAVRVLAAGDPEGHAEELFARAAAGWADHDARSELRALWGAGEAAARAGSARARERLETVEARAVTLGHESLLRRIRRSLRAAGVRRSQPRRTGTGPLSAREEEVLELVAEGLTSPQIAARLSIATSTVQTLVRSAMRKLGARTRIQAAALLRGSHDGPN